MKHSLLGTLFIACGLSACSGTSAPTVPPATTETPARPTAFEVQDDVRATWTTHATDLHMFVIEALAGLPDSDRALGHLQQNQDFLAATVAPFWGQSIADRLAVLLRERALVAGDLLAAMKANDVKRIDANEVRWFENGDRTAALFLEADPTIPLNVKALVRVQMQAVYDQMRARVDGKWAEDIAAQDLFVTHSNDLADVISWSIRTRAPDKVATPSYVDPVADQLRRDTYAQWRDESFWTRSAIVEEVAGLPDSYAATDRLIDQSVTLGDAVKPYYTPAEGSRLTLLLAQHVLVMIEYIDTSRGNDPAKTATVKSRLYAGANDIAAVYAKGNPNAKVDWNTLWRRHVDHAVNQIDARRVGDWTNDLAAYEESVVNDRALGDAIAEGILAR